METLQELKETGARAGGPRIGRTAVAAFKVPTDAPEADGTYEWDSTTLVTVDVEAGGATGFGYTYADIATATLIQDHLAGVIHGLDALAPNAAFAAMRRSVRNLGREGIASMAVSAVDVAIWDLKAKLLGNPLLHLLGAIRTSIPVYGSGGFTSYTNTQLQRQLAGWVREGIIAVKMKIGAHPGYDVDRVRAARQAIGSAGLFVDANGAYSAKQAIHMAEKFANFDVVWFEEPVTSDDLAGLRFIRSRAPSCMDIAAGEYGYTQLYFRRMLQAEAVDVIQADATRCGGITGFLKAAEEADSFGLPLSAHTSPSLHGHLCCAAIRARNVEYFHDHVRIERMLFDGALVAQDGSLRPDLSAPGLGLRLKRQDAEQYLVYHGAHQ